MTLKEKIENQIKELDTRPQTLNRRRGYCLEDIDRYGYIDPSYLNAVEQDIHTVEYARLILLDCLKEE